MRFKNLLGAVALSLILVFPGMGKAQDDLGTGIPAVGVPIDALPAASTTALPGEPAPYGFENPESGPWRDCDGIRRRVTVLNTGLVRGSSVRMRLELEGMGENGDAPAEFSGRLVFGVDIKVLVAPPGGKPFEYVPINTGEIVPNTIFKLKKNERIRVDRELLMDSESVSGALFETPGTYRLQIILQCPDAEKKNILPLDMGVFTVNVYAGGGDDVAFFDEMSKDPGLFRVLTTLNNASPAQIRAIEKIINTAPQANMRPNLLFAMSILAAPTRDDAVKAFPYLDAVLEVYPNHPVWEDALLRMIDLRLQRGEMKAAREYFYKAWQHPSVMTRLSRTSRMAQSFTGDYSLLEKDEEWCFR
jgi:hypothetical protein